MAAGSIALDLWSRVDEPFVHGQNASMGLTGRAQFGAHAVMERSKPDLSGGRTVARSSHSLDARRAFRHMSLERVRAMAPFQQASGNSTKVRSC